MSTVSGSGSSDTPNPQQVWIVFYRAYGDEWVDSVHASEESLKRFQGDRTGYVIEGPFPLEQP